MSMAETAQNPALQQEAEEQAASTPWLYFVVVAACFFLIEHDLDASVNYSEMMQAKTLEDLSNLEAMFQTRGLRQAGGLLLGLLGVLAILQRGRVASRPIGFLAGLLFFFFAWTALSTVWSIEPGVTVRRLVLFGVLAVAAAGYSGRFRARDILSLAIFVPLVFLAIGVAAEIAKGVFTPWGGGYRFAGTLHPNLQAVNCALLFLAVGARLLLDDTRRRSFILLFLLSAAFLFLTKSRTAMASTALAFFVYVIFSVSMNKKALIACTLAAGLSFFALFATVLVPALQEQAKLGREDVSDRFGTLTGRTALWEQLRGFAGERAVLGYGYGAFWTEANSWEVMEEQGWPISHAHNAYLDTYLQSGPVGTVLLILVLILGLAQAYRWHMDTQERAYAFLGVVLLFGAANSLLESVLIHRTFLTFLVMLILCHLALHQPEAEAAPESRPEETA